MAGDPRPQRVLFVADELDGVHGGTEGQLDMLLRNLPAHWEASLWTLREANALARASFCVPIRSLDLGSLKSPRTLRRLRALGREVREQGFDVIHGMLADTSLVVPLLAHYAGVPAITSRRDLGYWQTPRIVDALRRLNRLADAIVVNAEVVGERTVAIEHALPAQVRVVSNGHPPERFEAPADPELRARLGIPPDAPVIGLLANFRPLKRVDDLIDALARLGSKAGEAHVLLIGTGAAGAAHLERAAACGLGGRVHVHGVLGDVVPVLKHLTIGVLCSESEGLSNAIIEYMGCGLPVVASDVGGNPELVEDGVTGLLYPAGDVDALTQALRGLLRDDERRARLGAAGRERFLARYTLARMVDETVACYESVVTAREAPAPSALRWRVVTSLEELERLAPAWEALLGDGHFFRGPAWVLTWLRQMKARPCVPVAEDAEGALVGLLPLVWGERGVLTVCGEGMGADHIDVVAARGRAAEIAAGVLPALEGVGWRRLSLRHVSEDSALRGALRAPRGRYPYGERYATLCPFVRPGADWTDYLQRHWRRRKRSRLLRDTRRFFERDGARVLRVRKPDEVETALDRIMALHARRFTASGKTSSFAGSDVRSFHLALCRRLAEEGRLLLIFLQDADVDVAAVYAFQQGRRMHYFQTGFDPEASDGSPGLVLQGRIVEEDVIGAGLEELDFLDGDEAYKFKWASGVRRLYDLEIYPATRRGRIAATLRGLGAGARDEARRLAKSLRRGRSD